MLLIKIGERLLLWLFHWARLVDGLIGIITFAVVNTNLALLAAKRLSKYRQRHKIGRLYNND